MWEGSGTEAGVEIWRVENRRTAADTPDFGVARWPKDQYGCFYSGDSYIVLKTTIVDDGKKHMDIHFWLGESTSQDEMGVAAYKTVELDDLHDGEPIQHREVMGNESSRFLGMFPFMKLMEGGIESGFRHVAPEEYEPKLLHVKKQRKGKNMTVKQVPVSIDSLNHGDSFVLDAGVKIYTWFGDNSSPFEKNKAGNVQNKLIGERNGKARKGENDSDEFWAFFGGRGEVSSDEKPAPDPCEFGERAAYRLSDAGGSLTFTEVARGEFGRDVLDSGDVYVLDTGSRLFVWVGADASLNERRNSMIFATKYLSEHDRPMNTRITRVVEGAREHPSFQYVFLA
jgi:gelsolin